LPLTWNTYRVTIASRERIVGGIPIVPEGADRADIYEKWARGQGVEQDPDFEEPLHAALAVDPDMPVALAEEDVQGLETGFRHDAGGIYIEARQLKALLREAAQRLGLIKTKRGARQVIQHDLHVRALDGSQKLRLHDATTMEVLTAPTGKDRRPISVVTRQGPRTSIKRFDYVADAIILAELRVLAGGVGDGILGEQELRAMLELGQELGLGADRSQGEGTFDVVEFDAH
jgi:hypothetical protein